MARYNHLTQGTAFCRYACSIEGQTETSSSMHYENSYFVKGSPKQLNYVLYISLGELAHM